MHTNLESNPGITKQSPKQWIFVRKPVTKSLQSEPEQVLNSGMCLTSCVTGCGVNEFQNSQHLNVSHEIRCFIEMAGTHDFVCLDKMEGNVEPCKRRNGIAIGEVRFTPSCSLAQKWKIKDTSRQFGEKALWPWVCVLQCHDSVNVRCYWNTDESDASVVDVAVKVVGKFRATRREPEEIHGATNLQ